MRVVLVLATTFVTCFAAHEARSQTFITTSGEAAWNYDGNWSSAPFPNSSGAATVLAAPTAALTINLNQPITVGSLNVGKAASGAFSTTIQGSETNTLTFAGGTTLANGPTTGATGTGVTIFETPIAFTAGLSITQNDDDGLRLMQPVSGAEGLSINRGTSGSGVVAISNANTYTGGALFTGSGQQDYLLVRLNNANSIPGGIGATGGTSGITFASSVILGLRADDFKRSIGTGDDQFRFSSSPGPGQSGWAAFVENRAVNIGGAGAQVTWNQTNFNPGTLVLGHSTADKTIDFQNPLSLLTSGTSSPTRQIRIIDGSAAIDAKISGGISSPTTGTNSLTFAGAGTVSLTGPSTYNGITTLNNTVVIFEHANSLAAGNVTLTNTGVIGLATGDFTRSLGTGPGQVQFTINASNTNAGGGFAAFGANRTVNLGGASAPITWGVGGFVLDTNSNFLLSVESSDATVDFQNPLDLNGTTAQTARTFAVRDGSAAIDAKVSGVLSGTRATTGIGIIKGQAGTLELSAANTYDGPTTIQNGALLLTNANSIPGGIAGGNTNTILFTNTGGQIGLGHGDFTSDLGTGAGKVQFSAANNHGFAAYGADRFVNLGGASASVTWGANNFIGGQFLLNAPGADKTLDFQNPIDLNGATRTFDVSNGAASVDAVLSGVLGGSGGVQKTGSGTLKVTAANTYDSITTVAAGRLLVNNASGSGTGTGAVTVYAGGTLGGTGSIAGIVSVNSGGHVAPGEGVESLEVASLVFGAGSVLDFELGTPGSPGVTSDLINVTATDGLTFTGGSVALANAGGLAIGTYTLIDYAGVLNGDVGSLGTPTGPAGFAYSLVNNADNSSIDLSVSLAGVAGDYNGNGVVDGADYVLWRKNFGITSGATASQGDGDGDGDVDGFDYDYWRSRFGNTFGSGAALDGTAAVPEPTVSALFSIMAALVAAHKLGRNRK